MNEAEVVKESPVNLCLSVQQPYALLICGGFKDVENRTWIPKLPEKYVGKRIAIHAGQRMHKGYRREDVVSWLDWDEDAGIMFPKGAINGTAILQGYVEKSNSPWFGGPWGWVFSDAELFAAPVPMNGRLSLFYLSKEVQRAVAKARKDLVTVEHFRAV